MNLEINVSSDSRIHLLINGKQKKVYTGVYYFNHLPEYTDIRIKQIENQRKWYLFPIYILEGIFTLLLYCFAEYSVTDFIKPYLHECTFKVALQKDSKIIVNSICSNVDGEQGHLEVTGNNIYDIWHDKKFNSSSFSSVLIKTYFTCLCGPLLMSIVFLSIFLATSSTSVVGIVFLMLVSVFLFIVSGVKISREKRKLQEIKKVFYEEKIQPIDN